MKKTLWVAFLSAIVLAPVFSRAVGGHAGNGGHVVVCKRQEPVVLDFYHARLKVIGETQSFELLDPEAQDFLTTLKERMNVKGFESGGPYLLQFHFEKALATVGEIKDWIDTPLNPIADTNLVYPLPKGCKLQQAAVRQGSIQYGDSSVINTLSAGQKMMLRIHEALYSLLQNPNGDNSEPVRTYLRTILRKQVSSDELYDATFRFVSAVKAKRTVWSCSAMCFVPPSETRKVETTIIRVSDKNPLNALDKASEGCFGYTGGAGHLCNAFDYDRGACTQAASVGINCVQHDLRFE